ncbi:major facilitator superfamily domain-containing protein 3-like [Tubulanus polymorphus]|uniref:major facilitator superfamily domain-containing protein 3-like n=1 Tax=Tubulanus polymorphus TaxID=672921 RepID=UPI003DA2223D
MILSTNIMLLTFLYFVQGLPYGFQARFLPLYLRAQGVSLTNLSFFKLLLVPWLCKALWAPLVDRYGTKRLWLFWSMFGLMVTCAICAFIPRDFIPVLSLLLFVMNLFAATQDIAVDGIAIQILTAEELGHGNTAQVVGYKIGSIVGGGLLVWLMDVLGWKVLFGILTIIYAEAVLFVNFSSNLKRIESDGHQAAQLNDRSRRLKKRLPTIDEDDERSSISDEDVGNPVTDDLEDQEDFQCLLQTRKSPEKDMESSSDNVRSHFSFIFDVIKSPGTKWMMGYVIIYKLGEQGALNMLPLFLVDHQYTTADIGFWTGVVGQATSICGSALGGFLISKYSFPPLFLLRQLFLGRSIPLGAMLMLVVVWPDVYFTSSSLFCISACLMNVLLMISGMVTTATFTFMMQCSQKACAEIQATHYTTLATLEVFGKLTFSSFLGLLTDVFGYKLMFCTFIFLSGLSLVYLQKCDPCFVSNTNDNKSKDN